MNLLAQQIVNGVMLGSVYVTMAVAFTLTIGILNFLNFTIPALFMVTGMVAWAMTQTGLPGGAWVGLPGPMGWVPALAVGIAASVLVSLLVERFAYRYLKARYGDATEHAIPIVSSLGFLLILENLVRIWLGTDTQAFPTAFQQASVRLGGFLINIPQLISLAAALAIVFGLSLLLRASKTGRALRAIAENPDAATVIGIDVARIVPVVFVLTGLLCGMAAAIYAVNYGQVSSAMGDDVGTKAIAGMVIGGLGSIWGAIVGGLVVGLTEAMAIQFLGTDTVQVAVWGLLLVVLIGRPQGLFGHHAIGKGKL